MNIWPLAATIIFFKPALKLPEYIDAAYGSLPLVEQATVLARSPAAVGPDALLTDEEFSQIWSSFFGYPPSDPECGHSMESDGQDDSLIDGDMFLVKTRGFRREICSPAAWQVASLRIDPCRKRRDHENHSKAQILECSEGGRYFEVRYVLQPIVKTRIGTIFPDAALHLSFTLLEPNLAAKSWLDWRSMAVPARGEQFKDLMNQLRLKSRFNDAALMVAGAGLERWTFARSLFQNGTWKLDKLSHGGHFESITDASLTSSSYRTKHPEISVAPTSADLLSPMRIRPTDGSCISCHLADGNRPVRQFRQLGWGLQGEPIVSKRLLAEGRFSAKELQIFLEDR